MMDDIPNTLYQRRRRRRRRQRKRKQHQILLAVVPVLVFCCCCYCYCYCCNYFQNPTKIQIPLFVSSFPITKLSSSSSRVQLVNYQQQQQQQMTNDNNNKLFQFQQKITTRRTTTGTKSPVVKSSKTTTQLSSSSIVSSVSSSIITSNPTIFTIGIVLMHVVLGTVGTPFVVKATKNYPPYNVGWYNKINLPKWIPSNKLFPIVWTILYSCMGLSISRITVASSLSLSSNKLSLLILYWFHYILNLLWAPIFFGTKNFKLGLYINYILVISLSFGILRPFYTIDALSGIILVPYLLWLMFATILNEVICGLNPTDTYGYNNAKFYNQLQVLQTNAYMYAFNTTPPNISKQTK